jgi:hypothetical protein
MVCNIISEVMHLLISVHPNPFPTVLEAAISLFARDFFSIAVVGYDLSQQVLFFFSAVLFCGVYI